jgi:hypothetical protein
MSNSPFVCRVTVNQVVDLSNEFLPNSPDTESKKREQTFRELLLDHLALVRHPEITASLYDPSLRVSSIIPALRFCSPGHRIDFFHQVRDRYLEGSFRKDALVAQMLLFYRPREKRRILENLFFATKKEGLTSLRSMILRSARTVRELQSLLEVFPDNVLFHSKNPMTLNAWAICLQRSLVDGLDWPATPKKSAPKKNCFQVLKRLEKNLAKLSSLPLRPSRLQRTMANQDYRQILRTNLQLLRGEQKRLRGGASTREICDTTRMLAEKVKLELRFLLLLSRQRQHDEELSARQWKAHEIADIALPLKRLGEGRILFTPNLFHVIRIKEIKGAFAQRCSDGIIEITDAALKEKNAEHAIPTVSSLSAYFTHELGHAIPMGSKRGARVRVVNGTIHGVNDPLYDFSGFMERAEWGIPNRKGYRATSVVVIYKQREFRLGKVATLDDQEVIFTRGGNGRVYRFKNHHVNTLLIMDRSDPFEHWAESLVYYVCDPVRLRKEEPTIFQEFEEKFFLYKNRYGGLAI